MLLKCPQCNGGLEITGFEGSAVHTSCTNPGCMNEARPRSKRPPKLYSRRTQDSDIYDIINKIVSTSPEPRRKSFRKRWGGQPNVPVVYRKAFNSTA